MVRWYCLPPKSTSWSPFERFKNNRTSWRSGTTHKINNSKCYRYYSRPIDWSQLCKVKMHHYWFKYKQLNSLFKAYCYLTDVLCYLLICRLSAIIDHKSDELKESNTTFKMYVTLKIVNYYLFKKLKYKISTAHSNKWWSMMKWWWWWLMTTTMMIMMLWSTETNLVIFVSGGVWPSFPYHQLDIKI